MQAYALENMDEQAGTVYKTVEEAAKKTWQPEHALKIKWKRTACKSTKDEFYVEWQDGKDVHNVQE